MTTTTATTPPQFTTASNAGSWGVIDTQAAAGAPDFAEFGPYWTAVQVCSLLNTAVLPSTSFSWAPFPDPEVNA